MKLRYYQPQEREYVTGSISLTGGKKYKWYDCGPAKLQYEEDGFWYDVETVRDSEEAQYDGERTLR